MTVEVTMPGADGKPVVSRVDRVLLEISSGSVTIAGADSGAATATKGTPEAAPVNWAVIGQERDSLSVPPNTRVRYGVDRVFVEKLVSGPFTATNDFFGSDPVPGVRKQVMAPAQATKSTAQPAAVQSAAPLARIGQKSFPTLAQAADAAADGDVVEVLRPGRMQEATAAFAKQQRNEIVGAGGKHELRIDGSFRPAWGKGVIVHEGGDLTVRNLTLAGAAVPEDNGAGIRTGDAIKSLVCEDVDFVDNENGLLINNASAATVTLRRCNLRGNGRADNGREGYSHSIYANAVGKLELADCTVSDSVHGHNIKSRALHTVLTNVKASGSAKGRELDLPNGGKLHAKGCTFSKPAHGQQGTLIGIGHEGGWQERANEFVFEDCVFENLSDRSVRVILDNATTVPVRFIRCKGLDGGQLKGPHEIVA